MPVSLGRLKIMTSETAGRVFASHYQLMLCDDPRRPVPEEANWDNERSSRGFAGDARTRLVGTEADLNDHWVQIEKLGATPSLAEWQRVTLVHFHSETGNLHVMSVLDDEPRVSVQTGVGDFSVYVAGQNLGIDLLSLGEERNLTDDELAARKDLEWYKIFVVPGIPSSDGRIKDG